MATKTVTANGNAQIDTAQSKFGGASGLFDGTGDYLSTPDDTDWSFGTGNFTIETWVRFNSTANICSFFNQRVDGSNHLSFYWNPGDNKVYAQGTSGGVFAFDYNASWTPSTNTWYHVAFVRNGTSFAIYIDGTALSLNTTTAISTNTSPNIAATLWIANLENSFFFNGWMDEYRISKGSARYTGNFTPSASAFTTDASTALLLHMDGADASTTFTDSSSIIYTLVAESGSFSLTGINTSFRKNLRLAAGTGAFTLTGNNAALARAYTLIASTGSFILTGIDAVLRSSGWLNRSKNTETMSNRTKNVVTVTNRS